ncbi:hypothetical protein [Pseudopontixanthobacter vadosimaris]|nr:hypothetical protein [Pseudopontixanthobacter vadosimaris]
MKVSNLFGVRFAAAVSSLMVSAMFLAFAIVPASPTIAMTGVVA